MPILHREREPDLYYEIDDYTDPWCDAPYLLLQHGFGRSSQFWYRCVPYLARFYRIIRPDLRGFGRSEPSIDPPDEFTIEALSGISRRSWMPSAWTRCTTVVSHWAAFSACLSPPNARGACER